MYTFSVVPCMSAGQAVGGAVVAVDLELLRAVHALQLAEALQRHLGRAGDELQELGLAVLVERAQCAPEPLDLQSIRNLVCHSRSVNGQVNHSMQEVCF